MADAREIANGSLRAPKEATVVVGAECHPEAVLPLSWTWLKPVLLAVWFGVAALCVLESHLSNRAVQTSLATCDAGTRSTATACSPGLGRARRSSRSRTEAPPMRRGPVRLVPGPSSHDRRANAAGSAADDHDMELVLAHELAHVRRGDHWVRLVELGCFGFLLVESTDRSDPAADSPG